MAEVKNYGLSGVHRTLQLGKQGPILVGNADTDSFTVTLQDAATLTTMGGANATDASHFITKSQLDAVYTEATFLANVNYDDSSPILLGNISSGTKTIITTFEVTTAFDANAVVTVGDSSNNSLLLSDSYAEVEVAGTYQTINTVEFASNSTLNIYVTQGGATQGAGTVLVSVVDGPVVNSGTINYGGAGSGSGITDIVQDTSPQLGGNLDLNGSSITGSGNINILGDSITITNGVTADLTLSPGIISSPGSDALVLTSDDSTAWIQINKGANGGTVIVASEDTVNGVVEIKGGTNSWRFYSNANIEFPNGTVQTTAYTGYGNSNVVSLLSSFGSNTLVTTGNISGGNVISTGKFVGDGSALTNVTVSVAGNIVGTSQNVSLVAGSYTATFDNTGVLTLPAVGGDEGGEINFGIPTANTTLTSTVKLDVYQDRLRIFDGSTKGAYIDLSQAGSGVSTLLNNRVSGFVNAGTYVTMDNLKATVTTSVNRGLSLATVSGTMAGYASASFSLVSGSPGGGATSISLTTSASSSILGYNFLSEGDTATYVIRDNTNSRVYRITLIIGPGWNSNFIGIERLI